VLRESRGGATTHTHNNRQPKKVTSKRQREWVLEKAGWGFKKSQGGGPCTFESEQASPPREFVMQMEGASGSDDPGETEEEAIDI
jgi:hypothetical protein